MNTLKEITHRDPDILSGTPVFVGTRIPVRSLFDYLEGGDTLEAFLHQFPSVKRELAIAVINAETAIPPSHIIYRNPHARTPEPPMKSPFPHPEIIGSFHQFGPFGIPYQVLRPVQETSDGWTVEIEIPETGERLEYSLDAVLNDPEAR